MDRFKYGVIFPPPTPTLYTLAGWMYNTMYMKFDFEVKVLYVSHAYKPSSVYYIGVVNFYPLDRCLVKYIHVCWVHHFQLVVPVECCMA